MAPRAAVPLVLLLVVAAGCQAPTTPHIHRGGVPYGWDEDAPVRSQLATQTYYTLSESSTFLLKGASYGRYIVHVDHSVPRAELFFSSTNAGAPNATHPNIDSATYHYEFIQWRPLGKQIRLMDVNGPTFNNASTGHSLTLTYLYGRGTNYQYLVPYEGDPANWPLDPGFYEIVIATDDNLTVGLNIKLGTPLWSTFYHPQELGESRTGALETYVNGWAGASPRDLHQAKQATVDVKAGESLNYFCFADLIYRSNAAVVGADGTARVRVDDAEVPHRLSSTGVHPNAAQQTEAYVYAVSFNETGPVHHALGASLDFSESVSIDSDLAAQLLVFAVIAHPLQVLPGLPTRPA